MDKKFWFQLIGLVLLILIGAYITKNPNALNLLTGVPPNNIISLKIGDSVIKAEIADTPNKRAKGLSGRQELASNSGMLFVFDQDNIFRFWMKGMLIPLDFIWIKDNEVVDVLINVLPPSTGTPDQDLTVYQPKVPVNKVLEVNSGFINQHGIKIGDTIMEQK